MSDVKKDMSGELSMDEMEKVSGGKSGRTDERPKWADWPLCDDAFSQKCPGNPPCGRFGTPDCIQGHYNPEV